MDKLLHFAICTVVSAIFTVIFNINSGISFTAGLGIGKEAGDYMNYGADVGLPNFAAMSGGDMLADGLGIALGVIIGNKIKRR